MKNLLERLLKVGLVTAAPHHENNIQHLQLMDDGEMRIGLPITLFGRRWSESFLRKLFSQYFHVTVQHKRLSEISSSFRLPFLLFSDIQTVFLKPKVSLFILKPIANKPIEFIMFQWIIEMDAALALVNFLELLDQDETTTVQKILHEYGESSYTDTALYLYQLKNNKDFMPTPLSPEKINAVENALENKSQETKGAILAALIARKMPLPPSLFRYIIENAKYTDLTQEQIIFIFKQWSPDAAGEKLNFNSNSAKEIFIENCHKNDSSLSYMVKEADLKLIKMNEAFHGLSRDPYQMMSFAISARAYVSQGDTIPEALLSKCVDFITQKTLIENIIPEQQLEFLIILTQLAQTAPDAKLFQQHKLKASKNLFKSLLNKYPNSEEYIQLILNENILTHSFESDAEPKDLIAHDNPICKAALIGFIKKYAFRVFWNSDRNIKDAPLPAYSENVRALALAGHQLLLPCQTHIDKMILFEVYKILPVHEKINNFKNVFNSLQDFNIDVSEHQRKLLQFVIDNAGLYMSLLMALKSCVHDAIMERPLHININPIKEVIQNELNNINKDNISQVAVLNVLNKICEGSLTLMPQQLMLYYMRDQLNYMPIFLKYLNDCAEYSQFHEQMQHVAPLYSKIYYSEITQLKVLIGKEELDLKSQLSVSKMQMNQLKK